LNVICGGSFCCDIDKFEGKDINDNNTDIISNFIIFLCIVISVENKTWPRLGGVRKIV